jgi:hypothetical protein
VHRAIGTAVGWVPHAIGAEKLEDDALRPLEREMVDRGEAVEAFTR